jgi:hypothetical protein
LDPFNKLFDGGHTALAQLSNAQVEQLDEALGGAARRREWHWPRLQAELAGLIAAIGVVRVNISDDSL